MASGIKFVNTILIYTIGHESKNNLPVCLIIDIGMIG